MTDTLEDRLKRLIVETLVLEDVDPASIETEAPLFGEGLGLDSIDALELALAIHAEFGVRTREDDSRNREHYHSVGSLAAFIRDEQAKASASGA
ncbi:MAG TPA: phosphopantetheine-binding protein [Planctomycetota bacterium]|nr:phosphopantetheine-binding protein [Planctomycetota bacterium]